MSQEFGSAASHDVHYVRPIVIDVAPHPVADVYRPQSLTRMQVLLFAATCLTTTDIGGLAYSIPLLVTLLCHEFGHFLQARRWRVSASWPYFIPLPFPPLGTMGAVIRMSGYIPNRQALFDIGISGPLAGLVPTLLFSVVGLSLSSIAPGESIMGMPLLFDWLGTMILGPVPTGFHIELHPVAYAGWVGMFITALNLIPIGQLDGGHVLYALLRRNAHRVAQVLLLGALATMLITGNWTWILMLALLFYMGPNHPPTADDRLPLGRGRTILGWVTLAFIVVGFTPHPFQ